jgi:hypothetical protein
VRTPFLLVEFSQILFKNMLFLHPALYDESLVVITIKHPFYLKIIIILNIVAFKLKFFVENISKLYFTELGNVKDIY